MLQAPPRSFAFRPPRRIACWVLVFLAFGVDSRGRAQTAPGTASTTAVEATDFGELTVEVLPARPEIDDGYWTWLEKHLEERTGYRRRVSDIRLEVGLLAGETDALRARWLRLLYQENQLTPAVQWDPAWGAFFEETLGTPTAGALVDELRNQLDAVAWDWLGSWVEDLGWREPLTSIPIAGALLDAVFGAPLIRVPTAPGPQTQRSLRQERDLLRQQMNDAKERQARLIEEARSLARNLLHGVQIQREISLDHRPLLADYVEQTRADWRWVEAMLYDTAHWYGPGELDTKLEPLRSEGHRPMVHLLEAKLLLAQAADADRKIWLQMTAPARAPPDPGLIALSLIHI